MKYTYNANGERGLQLVLDNSSIDSYRRCPKKYELSVLHGWQPRGRAQATSFGAAFHKGMEIYDIAMCEYKSHQQAMQEAIIGACRYFAGVEPDSYRNIENLIRSIVWYFEEYGENPLQPISLPDGDWAIEQRFEVPLVGAYNLSLRVDKIVYYNGKFYVHDYKTTETTIGPGFFNKYSTDSQVSAYCWAMEKVGIPVAGFIIDAVQVAVGFNRYVRHIETRDKWQLDEWYDDTTNWVGLMEHSWRNDHYIRNHSSCFNCDFKGICGRAPNMRDSFLSADFVQNLEVK